MENLEDKYEWEQFKKRCRMALVLFLILFILALIVVIINVLWTKQ
jgi:ABC-type microcin C transport system permease subunit YejE